MTLVSSIRESISDLTRAVRERKLATNLPAVSASLVVHLALLAMLGMITYAKSDPPPPEFRTELVDTSLDDFEKLDPTALIEIDEVDVVPVAGSFAPETSPMIFDRPPTPPVEDAVAPKLEAAAIQVASVMLPKPQRLDDSVQIRGDGAEHVDNVEGAVDQIALEILGSLERGRTLVVWAFDASGSLLSERERLAKTIDGVYENIGKLDKEGLANGEALLTVVVGFGESRRPFTDAPTSDRSTIRSAIESIPLDKTGVESTFQTVGEVARRYGRYRQEKQSYRTLLIVVTDEVGDDEGLLEPAIAAAKSAKMPVYVLGTGALFSRVEGYQDYTDPVSKQEFRHLPVRQGPETAALEDIHLPFWYNGPQYDMLDSGFGPYALSRLSLATGGIYFITRLSSAPIHFDPAGMREYRPDWGSEAEYRAGISRDPIRAAVVRAAEIARMTVPGQPSLTFPPVDSPDFKDAMTRQQAAVAKVEYVVDEALGLEFARPGEPTIASVAKYRDRETSRRWRAHYDLVRGRLMAMKVRCAEFNVACARMKKDQPKFSDPKFNAWRLVPDKQVHVSEKAAKIGEQAFDLLRRVIREHPNTPWAVLAARELKDPLGLKWVEVTLPPPPKPNNGNGNNMKNDKPMPKPPEPPKL